MEDLEINEETKTEVPVPEPELQAPQKATINYKTNNWFFHFSLCFVLFFLGMFFLCQVYLTPIQVVGTSMQPSINMSVTSETDDTHNDIVYYRPSANYNYGDVVIVSNLEQQYVTPSNPEKKVDYLIKRILAKPGDTITFFLTHVSGLKCYYDYRVVDADGKIVQIDDDKFKLEDMYFEKNFSYGPYFNQIAVNLKDETLPLEERKTSIVVENGNYFIMGDNRNNSSDSRFFGQVAQKDICGNVRLQVKYGKTIWVSIFEKIKEFLTANYIIIKENL